MKLLQIISDFRAIRKLPTISIDLMLRETDGNDPFYAEMTRNFYRECRRRHRKFPLIRAMVHGVAVCPLPQTFDDYFMLIEAAGRRNFKKAKRNGYTFQRIDYNQYLDDVVSIGQSTDQRQGEMKGALVQGDVSPCTDPPSQSDAHDYAYFGVLKDDRLVAYGACLIAGELCMIEQIFGHADYQRDGVVPYMIVSVAGYLMAERPRVRYYAYGGYFGAGETMRRFKRKFGFLPHRVRWELGK